MAAIRVQRTAPSPSRAGRKDSGSTPTGQPSSRARSAHQFLPPATLDVSLVAVAVSRFAGFSSARADPRSSSSLTVTNSTRTSVLSGRATTARLCSRPVCASRDHSSSRRWIRASRRVNVPAGLPMMSSHGTPKSRAAASFASTHVPARVRHDAGTVWIRGPVNGIKARCARRVPEDVEGRLAEAS